MFAHIFNVFHPLANLLEVAIQGMVGKGGQKENPFIIKAMKLKPKNEDKLALCVQ